MLLSRDVSEDLRRSGSVDGLRPSTDLMKVNTCKVTTRGRVYWTRRSAPEIRLESCLVTSRPWPSSCLVVRRGRGRRFEQRLVGVTRDWLYVLQDQGPASMRRYVLKRRVRLDAIDALLVSTKADGILVIGTGPIKQVPKAVTKALVTSGQWEANKDVKECLSRVKIRRLWREKTSLPRVREDLRCGGVNIDKRSQIKGGSRRSGCATICTGWNPPTRWKTSCSTANGGRSSPALF